MVVISRLRQPHRAVDAPGARAACDDRTPAGANSRGATRSEVCLGWNFPGGSREYDHKPAIPVDEPMPASLTDSHAASDAALAARVACGDRKALEPLYRRHRGTVYRFALLWSGQAALAADVTQDVFLHLLTEAGDFDAERGALLPWLLGIARNFVRRRAGVKDDGDATSDDAEAPGAPLDAALIAREDLEALRRAVAVLPPRYRDVLVLVDLAERSYAEAAAICGCELNTVRSRLSRARALLARWLDTDRDARAADAALTRKAAS
jgi:RNA polymerase sigma-70 factor (ECF subfamily)